MGFFFATDVTLTIKFRRPSLSEYREAILDELTHGGPSTWMTLLLNAQFRLNTSFDPRSFQIVMWSLLTQNVIYRVEYNVQNRRYRYGLT